MKADWATATIDRAAAQASERSLWAGSGWARACLWLLLATGIVARLSPLLDPGHRLFWLFMSEDGYLMQTVARNLALGLGMSTADGTMPTNGVQPLASAETDLWLLTHPESRHLRRVAAVYAHLARTLSLP